MTRRTVPSQPKRPDADAKKRDVRAIVLPLNKQQDEDGVSHASIWEDLIGARKIVAPPFDMFSLASFPENNSELNQCIESMEVNIVGYGWQLIPLEGEVDPDETPELSKSVKTEYVTIDEFLRYGSYDGGSLTDLRRRLRRDLEATGNAYLELITDSQDKIVGFNQVPSHQMRLGVTDGSFTVYDQPRLVGVEGERELTSVKRRKRFRRFCQKHKFGSSYRQVWFKELGDPRPISCKTGEVLEGDDASNLSLQANPMVHMKLYSPRTPYGIPRYIGNTLSILGGRMAEEINYTTFKNNNMPSMLLMVSNGALTQGTIDRIQTFTESVIQGSDNYSKFLIIEADPDAEDGGQVKIDAQPLVNSQHTDSLFQEYDKNTTDKVRRAFRLPPIFVGKSDDYTKATAETSRKLGDEQVFAPEREAEDHLWNMILRRMGMKFHRFQTNSPNVTNDQDLVNVMKEGERSGAITPRIARRILEDIIGKRLPKMGTEVKLDVPFSLQMAEAVKNQAKPNEVGQQVTALKGEDGAVDFLSLRGDLIDELVRKEKSLSQGAMPGITLDIKDAQDISLGLIDEFELDQSADVSDRLFAVLDGVHCVAMVQLEEPVKKSDDVWTYRIEAIHHIEPCPYATHSRGVGFTDSVELY